jgi:hypothetical protein
MVVISALASEYCGNLAISPVDILRGLSSRLSLYSRGFPSLLHSSCLMALLAGVQEACLLSMLRLAAECTDVPSDIVKDATDIGQFARQRIRRVSDSCIALDCSYSLMPTSVAINSSRCVVKNKPFRISYQELNHLRSVFLPTSFRSPVIHSGYSFQIF